MEDSMDCSKAFLHLHLLKCEVNGLKDSIAKFINLVQLRLESFSTIKKNLISNSILKEEEVDIFNEFMYVISAEIQVVNSKICEVEQQTENISKAMCNGDEDVTVENLGMDANDSEKVLNDLKILDETSHLSTCDNVPKLSRVWKLETVNSAENQESENLDVEKDEIPSCSLCMKTFKTTAYLKRHLKIVHSSPQKLDDIHEDEKGESSDASDNGKTTDSSNKEQNPKNQCKVCNKTFFNKGSLKRHINTVHNKVKQPSTSKPPKPLKQPAWAEKCMCEVCGITIRRGSAKKHMLIHTGVKAFSCPICNKKFRTDFAKKEHVRRHTDVRPHLCGICGAAFKDSTNWKKHTIRHSGIKPFKCDRCPLRFFEMSQLKKHQRKYSDERPYKCKHCPAAYKQPSQLSVHVRSHTNERPYACPFCSKRYKDSKTLKEHKNVHLGIRFTCEVCGQSYSKKTGLMIHLKSKKDTCYKVFLANKAQNEAAANVQNVS